MRAVLVLLAACGRIDFGVHAPPTTNDGAVLVGDAPPVPATICSVDQVPVTGAAASSDLAIAATASGFVAVWTTGTNSVNGVLLDAQRKLAGSAQLPSSIVTPTIGGIRDTGGMFVLATVPPSGTAGTEVSRVAADLSTAVTTLDTSPGITGRDPFPVDQTGTHRAFLSAQGMNVILRDIANDGTTGAITTYANTGMVTGIAGDDGLDHVHGVWTTSAIVGESICTSADIRFDIPTKPNVMFPTDISDDCYRPRIDTPVPNDGFLIVATTASGHVEGHRIAPSGALSSPDTLSMAGRAPRVRSDGTGLEWTAWIDSGAGIQPVTGDAIYFATLDMVTGAQVVTPLPGWLPIADEAYELVRRDHQVYLAILSSDALTLLGLCQ